MTNPEEHQSQTQSQSQGAGADPADRPAGTVDEDANPPLSDPEDDTSYGGTGNRPPQDTDAAVPPYEGRT
jgi:hypothetical protein